MAEPMWYHALYEDGAWQGPHETREAAIKEGRADRDGEAFLIAQATNPLLRLSDWIDAESVLERATESVFDNGRASSEWDDEAFFASTEQEKDLIARIKRACDEWQDAHGLTFTVNTFEWVGPHETIPEEPAHD